MCGVSAFVLLLLQARTGGNLWVPEQPVSSSGRSGSKEDVLLPPGWRWAADWQLQDAAAGSSTEGWQYATSSSTGKHFVVNQLESWLASWLACCWQQFPRALVSSHQSSGLVRPVSADGSSAWSAGDAL